MFVSMIAYLQTIALFAIIAAVTVPGTLWLLKWDKQRLARKAAKKANNK